MGFEPFPAQSPFRPHFCDCWSPVPFPHSHLTPSEAFPCNSRFVSPHDRCLPAVTLMCRFRFVNPRPQGLAPLCESVAWSPVFLPLPTRCSLGLCSPSGSPPHTECSLERLGSPSAVADSLWPHSTASRFASWMLRSRGSAEPNVRARPSGCAAEAASRDDWDDANTAPCRPADHCQPALEPSSDLSCAFCGRADFVEVLLPISMRSKDRFDMRWR